VLAKAGTMESRNGRATAVPTPRNNILLESAFFII
jgi:hypothetical protein